MNDNCAKLVRQFTKYTDWVYLNQKTSVGWRLEGVVQTSPWAYRRVPKQILTSTVKKPQLCNQPDFFSSISASNLRPFSL